MAALTMQAGLVCNVKRWADPADICKDTSEIYDTVPGNCIFTADIYGICIYRNVGSGCYIFYIFSVDGICADSDHDVPVPENVSPWND